MLPWSQTIGSGAAPPLPSWLIVIRDTAIMTDGDATLEGTTHSGYGQVDDVGPTPLRAV